MERLEIELELLDKVGGPAKKAADALRKIEDNARGAASALNFSKELDRTSGQLAKMRFDPKGYKELLKKQRELNELQKKAGKPGWLESGAEEFAHKLRNAVAAAAIGEVILSGLEKIFDIFKEGVTEAFKSSAANERRGVAAKMILKQDPTEFLESAERMSKAMDISAGATKDFLLDLTKVGYSLKDASSLLATAADIQALSQGKFSAESAIDMFKRINAKEGITAKQLTTLGAGVGFKLPDFYKEIGKKLGVSPKAAEEQVGKSGKVDPTLILETIQSVVAKQAGGAPGTASQAMRNTLGGQFTKVQELPERYLENMYKSPAWEKIKGRMEEVLTKLDPESDQGKKISASLLGVFDRLGKSISDALSPKNIEAFASGAERAVNALKLIPSILDASMKILGPMVKSVLFLAEHMPGGDADINKVKAKYKVTTPEEEGLEKREVKTWYGGTRTEWVPSKQNGNAQSNNTNIAPKIEVHVHGNASTETVNHIKQGMQQSSEEMMSYIGERTSQMSGGQ